MNKVKDLSMDDITVGDISSFSRMWTEEDVLSFSKLSGDINPLHLDESYAQITQFGRRLVHGMLVASLCSRLVGVYLPGKRCLYLGQTLLFKKPVYIGDTVIVTGTVMSKSVATKILSISISMTREGEEVLAGEARVQVL
jgi:3-hydroxybutyryl-CoA dehydratase